MSPAQRKAQITRLVTALAGSEGLSFDAARAHSDEWLLLVPNMGGRLLALLRAIERHEWDDAARRVWLANKRRPSAPKDHSDVRDFGPAGVVELTEADHAELLAVHRAREPIRLKRIQEAREEEARRRTRERRLWVILRALRRRFEGVPLTYREKYFGRDTLLRDRVFYGCTSAHAPEQRNLDEWGKPLEGAA